MVKLFRLRSLPRWWRQLKSPERPRSKKRRFQRRQSLGAWCLALLMGLCCLCGWGLAGAKQSQAAIPEGAKPTDVTPQNLALSEEAYLNRCATCHVALPPAVLATETWRDIILDTSHYNASAWTPLRNPDLALIWKYLRTGSRQLDPNEQKIYRVARSRYFRIFHPRVQFKEPATIGTCVSCHPSAQQFNYRDLAPQWKDAP